MKKTLSFILLLSVVAVYCGYGQQRQGSVAKVNGVEVMYLSPKDGSQIKYRTDSLGRGLLLNGDVETIVNYTQGIYTILGRAAERIPQMAKPRKSDKIVDILGWKCRVKKQGNYCVYYTTDVGFAATPAPWIAAPKDGAIMLISDLKNGEVLCSAVVLSQIH